MSLGPVYIRGTVFTKLHPGVLGGDGLWPQLFYLPDNFQVHQRNKDNYCSEARMG